MIILYYIILNYILHLFYYLFTIYLKVAMLRLNWRGLGYGSQTILVDKSFERGWWWGWQHHPRIFFFWSIFYMEDYILLVLFYVCTYACMYLCIYVFIYVDVYWWMDGWMDGNFFEIYEYITCIWIILQRYVFSWWIIYFSQKTFDISITFNLWANKWQRFTNHRIFFLWYEHYHFVVIIVNDSICRYFKYVADTNGCYWLEFVVSGSHVY